MVVFYNYNKIEYLSISMCSFGLDLLYLLLKVVPILSLCGQIIVKR